MMESVIEEITFECLKTIHAEVVDGREHCTRCTLGRTCRNRWDCW